MFDEDFQHGHKHYKTINGVRHLVGLRPTLHPSPAEHADDFVRRMQRLDEILHTDPKNLVIEHALFHVKGVVVGCEFDIRIVPQPQPILEQPALVLTIPARRAKARGSRGGRK